MTVDRHNAETARLAYLEDRVLSADPVERVCICFEEIGERLRRADALLARREGASTGTARRALANEAHGHLMKACAFLGELQAALDRQSAETEVRAHAEELFRFYEIVIGLVVQVDRGADRGVLEHVRAAIGERLTYWRTVRGLYLEEQARQAEQRAA